MPASVQTARRRLSTRHRLSPIQGLRQRQARSASVEQAALERRQTSMVGRVDLAPTRVAAVVVARPGLTGLEKRAVMVEIHHRAAAVVVVEMAAALSGLMAPVAPQERAATVATIARRAAAGPVHQEPGMARRAL